MIRLAVKGAEPAIGYGVMVALYPPAAVARSVAHPDGTPAGELHITLADLGDVDTMPDGFDVPLQDMLEQADLGGPLSGQVGGLGRFPEGPNGEPVWVPVDVPGLVELRQQVVAACAAAGVPAAAGHGYTPHLTLGYNITADPVPATPVVFDTVWLVIGGQRVPYPLRPMETKAAQPPAGQRPEPPPVDGKPLSPGEMAAPTEDDPDADPRALSPDGAVGYFADKWGEMEAWFFDDGDTLVGYVRTPQEVIRIDDIDEWAREVDEAGLELKDPPTGDETPPASAPQAGRDSKSPPPATDGAGGGPTPEGDDGVDLFDFSDLDGDDEMQTKHMPGQHQQRRHGNRYGIRSGVRVLTRAATRPMGQAMRGPSGPSGTSAPSTRQRDRAEVTPAKQRPALEVVDDTDTRLPFRYDKVGSLQDLWEMNTDDATADDVFKAKLRATDPDLAEELDMLYEQKLEQVLLAQKKERMAAAAKKAAALARAEQRGERGGMAGSDMSEKEAMAELERAALARLDRAKAEIGAWFWSRDAVGKMERGDLPGYSEQDIFTGRVPRDFLNRHVSEELGRWFDENGWPTGLRKGAGGVRDNTNERPYGEWERGRGSGRRGGSRRR